MKKLFLLRHAKSDWSQNSNGAGGSDHSRPISKRGRENAKRLGNWMAEHDLFPQQIISSDAFRTQQTVELLTEHWPASVDIQFTDLLYLASDDSMLELIQLIPETMEPVMLVAHNPGMDELVSYLCEGELPFTDDGKLMATCNMAVFDVTQNWVDVGRHSLPLVDIVRPKGL